jgi:hypothetical protein
MTEPLIVYRYWIVDESTGRRRLTSTHMSAEEAAKRYPAGDPQPEPSSRERRWPAESRDPVQT